MTVQMWRLGDLVDVKTGKLDVNAGSPNGLYPFFTCAQEPYKIDNYAYDCECVLVAGNGDLNVKHYSGKFNAYQRTYIIQSKNNSILNIKYLFLFLDNYLEKLRVGSIGGVIKYIKLNHLTDIGILLPPLATQQHIARVLEQADQLRKQAQQMERELNQLAQSLFLEMFGDPVRNPKGWKIIPLSCLADVQGGLQVTHRRDSLPVEVPYLRVANVFKDKLDLDEVKTIRVTEQELERTALQKGDMLVVEGHGNKDEIGRAAIWEGELDVCIHQNHLIRVRFDLEKIIPQFVSIYLNSSGGREQIRRLSKTTSGLNTISTNNVKSLKLIVPDRETQQTYTDAYAAIQQQLSELKSLKDSYEGIFNSLMQRAFNGELIAPERKAA